jgi:hypothetical protein
MLDQLCYLVGVGVGTYYGLRAVFSVLGWVFLRIAPPIDRLDLWLKSNAPQHTYTRAEHVRGSAVLWSLVGLVGLVLHLTVGLH